MKVICIRDCTYGYDLCREKEVTMPGPQKGDTCTVTNVIEEYGQLWYELEEYPSDPGFLKRFNASFFIPISEQTADALIEELEGVKELEYA